MLLDLSMSPFIRLLWAGSFLWALPLSDVLVTHTSPLSWAVMTPAGVGDPLPLRLRLELGNALAPCLHLPGRGLSRRPFGVAVDQEEVPRGCRAGRPALGSALTDRRTDVALGNQNKVKYMATQLLAKFEENAPAQSSGLRRQVSPSPPGHPHRKRGSSQSKEMGAHG